MSACVVDHTYIHVYKDQRRHRVPSFPLCQIPLPWHLSKGTVWAVVGVSLHLVKSFPLTLGKLRFRVKGILETLTATKAAMSL